jgi:hypothetical protein
MSLHTHTGGLLAQLREFDVASGVPSVLEVFDHEETLRCAQEYKQLTAEHDHEKTAREWDREMERPRGKGRPKKQSGAEA